MNSLKKLPPDALFALQAAYNNDLNQNKMNLGIGAYIGDNGKPFVLPLVQSIAEKMSFDDFSYLPIKGDADFLEQTGKLVLGEQFDQTNFAMQATCGGTQACSLFAHLGKSLGIDHLLLPSPSWSNHKKVFADFTLHEFPHLTDEQGFSVDTYLEVIESIPEPAILLLHGGPTHNPTGINYTKADLEKLLPVLKKKQLFVLVDFAYLGLGKSVLQDSELVRFLVEELSDIAIAFSYSKNATLYSHRTGALLVKTDQKNTIESHLQHFVRTSISNPPSFGQMIVKELLLSHKEEWGNQLDLMRMSIDERRDKLVAGLEGRIEYLAKTAGMFGMMKLSTEQIHQLQEQYSIYMPQSGRISFAGIPLMSIDRLIDALKSVLSS